MIGEGENVLRLGPSEGPVVLVSPALFEEANRTRTLLVGLLRRLAALGIGSVVPDLPGTGESLVPTEAATLVAWRHAFAAHAATLSQTRPVHIVAVRGGALVDIEAEARSRWYLSPVAGVSLVREMLRARTLADPAAAPVHPQEDGPPIELAGNLLSQTMLRELIAADIVPASPLRVVRLGGDPAPADHKIDAVAPWRRSEPADDIALAEQLGADIAHWVRTCAA